MNLPPRERVRDVVHGIKPERAPTVVPNSGRFWRIMLLEVYFQWIGLEAIPRILSGSI